MIMFEQILQEIGINDPNKFLYKIYPETFVDPDENDTMKTWYEKNQLNLAYTDKVIGGYSYKFYGLGYRKIGLGWNEYYRDKFSRRRDPNFKSTYIKPVQSIRKIVKQKIQSYFDKVCGPGRVKVSVQDRIRLIIPVKAGEFKMIP